MVHRDLKPHNIFLVNHDGALELKIGDFGLARGVASGSRDGSGLALSLAGASAEAISPPTGGVGTSTCET